jgi:hypothetical protein
MSRNTYEKWIFLFFSTLLCGDHNTYDAWHVLGSSRFVFGHWGVCAQPYAAAWPRQPVASFLLSPCDLAPQGVPIV